MKIGVLRSWNGGLGILQELKKWGGGILENDDEPVGTFMIWILIQTIVTCEGPVGLRLVI